jgi:hypothetical protein
VTWATVASVKARIPATQYAQVFDPDNTGVSGTMDAYCTTCLAEALSMARMRLGPAFPTELDASGAVIDEQVIGAHVALTLWVAVRYSPLATGDHKSPYRQAYEDAMALFDRMKADTDRPTTSPGGRARPRAKSTNLVDANGMPTSVFARQRDGKDNTGF